MIMILTLFGGCIAMAGLFMALSSKTLLNEDLPLDVRFDARVKNGFLLLLLGTMIAIFPILAIEMRYI